GPQRSTLTAATMATGAACPTQLAAVNAFTEQNHFSCGALRNRKIAVYGCAGVRMRALRWLCRFFNGIAGRSRRTRTRRDTRGVEVCTSAIVNSVDLSTDIVGNVD